MRILVKLLLLGAVATAPLALGGCGGFTPLYAEAVTVNLAQIDIEVPQTRTGYFLAQDLKNGFATDTSAPRMYLLKVAFTEKHYSIGYKIDETATRTEITSGVNYTLTDLNTNKVAYRGKFTETVTYDTTTSPFTGVVSQQDAQERLATSISQKIQTDLALYFRGKQGS